MQGPVGVKKEHIWRYKTQFVSKRNMCEDAIPSWCQNGTYVKMQYPVCIENENKWGCGTQLVSKRNICEDARPSWCQKGTYVKMQDPVGDKKGTCLRDHPFSSISFYPHVSIWGRFKGEKAKKKGSVRVLLTASLKFLRLKVKRTSHTISINVTLRRIRVYIVAVGEQSECFCSLIYEGWNFNFGSAAVTFDTAHLQSSYFHRPSMYSPKLGRTRSQRWESRMMPLAAPVLLMVQTERSTAEGLNPPCNCPIL